MLILSPLYGRKARICANFTRFDCLFFGYYSFLQKIMVTFSSPRRRTVEKKAFAFRNTRRHFKPPKQTIICRKDNGLHSRAELLTFSPRRLKGDTRLPPNASLSPNRSSLLMELVNVRVLFDRLILFYYIRFR